jgi:uncharacterized membrane protein YidH (DUF202 family)
MTTLRVLYHLARADFLERVRRYSFLVTLTLTAYYCYVCLPPNHASYVTMQMGGHRGIYNSAYLSTIVAMETALLLSLAGFYLVKNAVDRDLRTGVGQILATTPLTKPLYTLGKALSNFAVLAVMVGVMALAAVVMQLARGEDMTVHVGQILAPFLVIVLPVMTAVAGMAVLFEVIPALRGGLGNVAYFLLWMTAMGVTVAIPANANTWLGSADMMAFGVVVPSIRAACETAFPGCATAKDFSMGFNFGSARVWDLTTFHWDGIHWNSSVLLGRSVWIGLAAGAVLLAAVFFHRFDPAREHGRKPQAPPGEPQEREERAAPAVTMQVALAPLASAARRFRFGALVRAELRIALQGLGRWWYVVALGFLVGGLVSPLAISRFFLVAAWIWPILIWSAMGTREARQGTGQLVFCTAHPLRRQLPACWLAGVLVAVLTGLGPAIRLLLARDSAGLAAWTVGALFIPTLALALGVWSGSGKLFEVAYMLLWYVGPLNQVAPLDYMGATAGSPRSGTPLVFLLCTFILGVLALAGRKRQIGL